MPKSKSLLNKTSTKKIKERNKYSEKPKSIKADYLFDLHEQATYQGGLYPDKTGKICIVVGRSQNRAGKQYYKVEFNDNLVIETIVDTLTKKEIEEKEDKETID